MTRPDFVRSLLNSPFMRMAHIMRYSSLPVLHRESVAEHTFFVCWYALAIAKDYANRYPGHSINTGKLLTRAVVHDLDESLSGDVIRPFKYSNDTLKTALDAAAADGLEDSLRQLFEEKIALTLFRHWALAKEDSIEGQILQVADMMSVVMFARREWALGNAYARRVIDEIKGWLSKLSLDPTMLAYRDALIAAAGEHTDHPALSIEDFFFRAATQRRTEQADDDLSPQPTES